MEQEHHWPLQKEVIWKPCFSVSKNWDLSQHTLWGGMPWPLSTKLSGRVVVDRWLRWNFKQPEARNHGALQDTHWEGCSKLWFFSKPLADAKITKQAWDLGSLQWCPSSVISTKGFKTFLFLNYGKQKDRDFFIAPPYFLNWVFSMQVSFSLCFICWILSYH